MKCAADLSINDKTFSNWVADRKRELGMEGAARLKSVEPKVNPEAPARPDLVRRWFNPPVPITVLCGDITYLHTGERRLYFASVVDLSTRMVVGWSFLARMNSLAVSSVTCGQSVLKTAMSCVFAIFARHEPRAQGMPCRRMYGGFSAQ